MRPTPALPLLATLALLACAAMPLEPKPPATDQLARKSMERVVERYKTLKAYRLEGASSTVVSTRSEHNESGRSMRFLVQRPGRFISEVREPQFTSRMVANGESVWTAVPELAQYTAESQATLLAGADSVAIRQQLDPATDYAKLLDGVVKVQTLSRDTVRTARGVVQCERYALTRAAADSAAPGITIHPRVVWVDPATRLVLLDSLRIDQNHPQLGPLSSVSMTRLVVAEADPSFAASTFTFHPDDGARRVRRFQQRSPEHEALEG